MCPLAPLASVHARLHPLRNARLVLTCSLYIVTARYVPVSETQSLPQLPHNPGLYPGLYPEYRCVSRIILEVSHMISLLPQAPHLAKDGHQDTLQMNELGNVRDALKPTTELLSRSVHAQSVRLYCTVPTWAPSSDLCIDLHDLHDLRSRSLLFIHDLVESLRASGVPASYTLAPSNSPVCLVCASHSELDKDKVRASAHEALEKTKPCARERVHFVQLKDGPALVIT